MRNEEEYRDRRLKLQKKGLKVGETAIDFTLSDINGNEFTLSEMLREKPVVMELGSFT